MENKQNKSRPPYWVSILCLIPALGAVVAVGMMIFGVIKFKNLKIILLGFVGLIPTFAFYGFLMHFKYTEQGTKGDILISQEELQILVSTIENYKIKNGNYPDSLETLGKLDHSLNIYDPFRFRKSEDNGNLLFMYKRVGEKYTIFSIGPDETPNTKDDIYPLSGANGRSMPGFEKNQIN